MAAEARLPAGTQLGRYEIVRELKSGGMGTIYLARDTLLGRTVALKAPKILDDKSKKRFQREVLIAAKFAHPNLCYVNDFSDQEGQRFFTMPYYEGVDLSERIVRGQPWPVRDAVAMIEKIGGAVAYLHDQGVIHRDLKPHNILVRTSGEPILLDFGLVRDLVADERLTIQGELMGTMQYMPPEQFLGNLDVGKAADIYSLGVILYELLTGRLPFDGSAAQLTYSVQHIAPPSLRTHRPDLDPRLDRACLKALMKSPAHRPASVAAFLKELRKCLASDNSQRRSKRLTALLLLLGLPALGAGAIALGAAPPLWTGLASAVLVWLSVWFVLRGEAATTTATDRWPDTAPPVEPPGEETADDAPLPAPPRGPAPAPVHAPFAEAQAVATQQAWAVYLERQVVEPFDLGAGVVLQAVLIPPGAYSMGSPDQESGRGQDETRHVVTITRPFYLGKFPVTQEQYRQLLGQTPSRFSAERVGADVKRYPVEQVSWTDAVSFCQALSARIGLKVELPSEAEWEYACRAGTTTPFHFGPALNGAQANCDGTFPYGTGQRGRNWKQPRPVGDYPANAFGLHDLHGNVLEWCADSYGPYQGLSERDPLRVAQGDQSQRVARGGSWFHSPVACRAASRHKEGASRQLPHLGFRIAIRLD